MAKKEPHRFRVSIPNDDALVLQWLSCQNNISMSIRMMIRECINERGMRDYFATDSNGDIGIPVTQPVVQQVVQPTVQHVEPQVKEDYSQQPVVQKPMYTGILDQPVTKNPAAESARERLARMQGIMNK